jgi:hypothetical protein
MKARLRIPFALLAILAMFATMLPRTIWACPMTGRIDVAARVCREMGQPAGEMPCAKPGGKCCKPLTVPPSADDEDPRHPHVYAAPAHAPGVVTVDLTAFQTVAPAAVGARPLTLRAPAVRTYLARFNNSPPPWWPQYRPTSLAGRAPPVF